MRQQASFILYIGRARLEASIALALPLALGRFIVRMTIRSTILSELPVSARTVQSYKVLVGMEIHVQLATASKMFTAAPNGAANFGADPNSLVDEVVLGL